MNRKFYQKWNAFYSKVSLRYVIWGAFTLTALLGAVLMGTSFYNRFSLQLQGIVEKQNRALIEQVNNTLTSELRNIMRISDSLYFSVLKSEENVPVEEGFALLYDTNKSSIQNIALFSKEGDLLVSAPAAKLKPGVDVTKEAWFQNAVTQTENQHFSRPHVQNLFVNSKGNYSAPAAKLKPGVDVTKEAWFQNAVTQTENQHFSRPHVQNLFVNSKGNYAHVLTLSRMVQVPDAYEVQDGVLLIDLKYEQLESIFKNVSLGEEGYIYLVDGAGNLIYHPQQQLILDGIEQENHEKASAYKDGVHDEVFEGQHRKVTIKSVGYTGWKIVGVVSDKAAQLSTVKNIIFLIALVMSFMLILSIINSYISKKVTIPIEHLEGAVKRIAEGDLETTIEERGAYEISHLGRSIRKMKVRIKKFYLVDGAGKLIYHPQQQLILDGIEQENHEKASAYKDGVHDEVFEGQHRKVTIKSVGYTGWKIVGVVSDKAAQLSTVKNIIFLIALVMSFMLILSIINSYISKKVTIPIEHLEGAVKRIAEGDLETTIEDRGAYEISHLGRSIRKMKVRIKKLMEEADRGGGSGNNDRGSRSI